jgi:aminopeptidase YwaD
MEIAKQLAQEIGPRVSGSPKELETAEFLSREFQKIGIEPKIQKFKYLGWEQVDRPSLSVLCPTKMDIKVSPMAYTGSTPRGGVEGILRFHGIFYLFPRLMELPKYAIIDDRGEKVAFLLVQPGSRSRPIPNPWLQILQDPMVLVGEEEFKPILKAIESRKDVRVHLEAMGKYVQSFTSYNVIATLEGKRSETIIIGGHHDSVEGSPGANDNASGVEGIFRMARKLLHKKRNHTFKLITWGGHEWGLFGSQYFVRDEKERGSIEQVKACLTLDVLGCGDFLWIWAGPPWFRGRIEATLKNSGFSEKREIRYEDTLIGSDDWSFSVENIPHALFMEWPAENLHFPSDLFENIDENKLNYTVDAAYAVIEDFDKGLK